jgi:hypothetical protein
MQSTLRAVPVFGTCPRFPGQPQILSVKKHSRELRISSQEIENSRVQIAPNAAARN